MDHRQYNRPYVEIFEQPAGKSSRFRYICEGRSAGSIPGVNSTSSCRTFPSIRIIGYKGRAVVVVSCVTKDEPYRAHPHNLVGKGTCNRGVCTIEVYTQNSPISFANLGIQCVKKKEIAAALKLREEIRVDPYRNGFQHKNQCVGMDLNAVRLCFQVFLEGPTAGKFGIPLDPVVSEPIYDKKSISGLTIHKLSHCSAPVIGGMEMIILCEKVNKDDIRVVFYEMDQGHTTWRDYGVFKDTDVHKQTAISLKTPAYRTHQIDRPVEVFIQLNRPSDGESSDALPFTMIPSDADKLDMSIGSGYSEFEARYLVQNDLTSSFYNNLGDPVYTKRKRQKFSTSGLISQLNYSECICHCVPKNVGVNASIGPQNIFKDDHRTTLLRQLQAEAEKSVADGSTAMNSSELNFDISQMMKNCDPDYSEILLSASFDSLLITDATEHQIQSVKNSEAVTGVTVNNNVWPR